MFIAKKYKFPLLFLIILSALTDLNAYKFDFLTVSDVVKSIREKFSSIDSYEAGYKVTSDSRGSKKIQSGVLKYKNPDKILIEFHRPAGQRIVSDGERMWIYIPEINVVAEQDLKSESGFFSSGSRSGLNRLFSKYHYRFLSKEQPSTGSDGAKYYTLYLQQKESRSGFRNIKLWINEDFMITRAEGETSSGRIITVELANINTGVNLKSGIFKFNVPPKARLIKNPMVAEEE